MVDDRPTTAQPDLGLSLTEAQFELVALLADGELAGDAARRTQAQALLQQLPDAQSLYESLCEAKLALRDHLLGEALARPVTADMSSVRGRIMSRLPAEPRPAVVHEPQHLSLGQWLRAFGISRLGLGAAAVVLAALVVLAARTPAENVGRPVSATIASEGAVAPTALADEPAVIIEEIDVDSGSVAVRPGTQPSQSTVIWHFQAEGEG